MAQNIEIIIYICQRLRGGARIYLPITLKVIYAIDLLGKRNCSLRHQIKVIYTYHAFIVRPNVGIS